MGTLCFRTHCALADFAFKPKSSGVACLSVSDFDAACDDSGRILQGDSKDLTIFCEYDSELRNSRLDL